MASRFEKFSERARRVLALAQEEATQFNHNYIGTEHILLGLIRESEGVAAKVLVNLKADTQKIRSAVEFIIGKGDKPTTGEIGLTPRAKKVIELAVDEARNAKNLDEVPVGAVIVCDNQIIARAHNYTEKLNDVTAHAAVSYTHLTLPTKRIV